MSPINTLILGHSFVRRLRDWCVQNGHSNLGFDSQTNTVQWHGVGGGGIQCAAQANKNIWDDLSFVSDLSAHIVHLEIGSNDLCDRHVQPRNVGKRDMQIRRSLYPGRCSSFHRRRDHAKEP